ncbi:hypothetical protein AU253_03805 [Yersinia pestis]|nr:hypothetical protein AU253_03805 [Yersinia pestis]
MDALKQNGFTGDTATNYADRLTMATDNSIYQLLPDAVVFPRSTADVALVGRLAGLESFKSLVFTPRGGGNGNQWSGVESRDCGGYVAPYEPHSGD